ncbi:response regulator [Hymenobacter pini]|uniref:response regulator n=1 Tax=Hymenobacter pini TaxID=2880879 RepID=UPI001CF0F6FD|nr:response regulator transcription factor [Hymenobacter pini]MCA8830465.1 response regulator transcription factor [Hymenobacter pini]
MIRVVLVDDHAVLRDGLRALLASEPLLEVVGEAENGEKLLELLPSAPADVVLLDMNMPVLDGLATALRLREEFPTVRVIMLSMVDNEFSIGQALDAGVAGYVLKNADKAEILVAIQMVAAGKRFLCSELGLVMLQKVLSGNMTSTPKAPDELSPRERQVLRLVGEGLTTAQIADKLFTSPRTVETHRQNIMEKTGAKNTAALVRYAMERGWLD